MLIAWTLASGLIVLSPSVYRVFPNTHPMFTAVSAMTHPSRRQDELEVPGGTWRHRQICDDLGRLLALSVADELAQCRTALHTQHSRRCCVILSCKSLLSDPVYAP
jgi:hypothetical protein